VLQADGAAAALQCLRDNPDVVMLFTDIVMPETNGRKLVDEALRLYPKLKVLYTTGYTRNAVVHNGVVDKGVELIGKPFTIDELAARVRALLDAT
jgi:CheY-like chemotaxis protein